MHDIWRNGKDGFKIYVSRFRACMVHLGRSCGACAHGYPLKPGRRGANPTGRPFSDVDQGVATCPGGVFKTRLEMLYPWCASFAQLSSSIHLDRTQHRPDKVLKLGFSQACLIFKFLFRQMWLLGSASQVLMADERTSPPARPVQSPGSNPATVHSIEAILGFKEDTIFHKSASYNLTEKDAERSGAVAVMQTKKAPFPDSCGESGQV